MALRATAVPAACRAGALEPCVTAARLPSSIPQPTSAPQAEGSSKMLLRVAAAAPLGALGVGLLRRSRASRRRGHIANAACSNVARRSVATSEAEAPPVEGEFEYKIKMEELVSLCKRRGFVFQSGEVYGGYAGFFDYGPLGVELKNNLKKVWWRRMVYGKDNVVGLDAAIITAPSVHQASGHVDNFSDPMVDCLKSKKRYRADQLFFSPVIVEEDGKELGCVSAIESADTEKDLMKAAKKLLKDKGYTKLTPIKPLVLKDMTEATEDEVPLVPSPATGEPGTLTAARAFNLMFETQVGPYADSGSTSYLRPETAQGIFVNFKNVATVSRMKVPFGIAQVGKAFRNEITPRQFLFRSREFEQMEVEYFIDPEADFKAEQEAWLKEMETYLKTVGLDERLIQREVHEDNKLAHYARACTDILFRYPFGVQELLGVAARGQYDLDCHAKASGQSMEYQVPGEKRKFVPHVIEPSLGVDRLFLAVMCSCYDEDEVNGEKRSLLRFEPCVAPVLCGIFPLLKNKPEIVEKAKGLAALLRRKGLNVFYDASGSIGRRYRRMDEIGAPFCCTIDFDTLEDDTVTLRDRDDPLKVQRFKIDEIPRMLQEACEIPME